MEHGVIHDNEIVLGVQLAEIVIFWRHQKVDAVRPLLLAENSVFRWRRYIERQQIKKPYRCNLESAKLRSILGLSLRIRRGLRIQLND